ncbi:hypothetical protein OB920_09315 [Halobacteria archaeon HArc-gm2]|nr:hypothetical protein [Halobacteria archaeon HArc-gm2]
MTGHDAVDDPEPTRTSTLVVVLASVLTAATLVRAADVVWPALLGAMGAVTLAGVVWASGWERHEAAGSVLASVLVLPVGVGIVAATAGTVLVLAGGLFPVPSAADVPGTVIALTARAAVVTGAVAAVFGATTATRGVLDADTLEDATTTAVRTAVVPFCLAILLAGSAALQFLESNAAGPGIQTVVGDVLRGITSLFFQPDPLGPHLPTFAVMAGAALLAAHRGVHALPITELLPENETGDDYRERIEAGQRRLFWAGLVVVAAAPIAAIVHLAVPPRQLRAALGSGLYDVVLAVTANPALRSLAWWLILCGVAVAGVVWLLRRLVQSSPDRIGSVLAPFAGGVGVVALAFAVSDNTVFKSVAWVADQLPGKFSVQFMDAATPVMNVYGFTTIGVAAAAALLFLATVAVSALWAVLATGYVEGRTAGVTIASLALFNTAAFAGVLDVSNVLVLGALVGAVLVWDAGEFGVTLGQEVGRLANTRRAELVHATGTLAVGGVGAGVALLIGGVGAVDASTGPVALGLVAVLGGLLLLVVALR